MGFFFSAPDAPNKSLIRELASSIPFPVIGGTSIADPLDSSGAPFASRLSFLRKKNVSFSVGVSPPLVAGQAKEQLQALHDKCLAGIDGPPKLYIALLPVLPHLFIDTVLEELFRLADDIPVIGGLISADYDLSSHAVFFDGKTSSDSIILVALTGDVRPKIALGCEVTVPYEYGALVTECDGNIIRRVDGITFGDYLSKVGYDPHELKGLPLSLRIIPPGYHPGDKVETNALIDIDPDAGSATFTRNFELGSLISVCFLNKANIARSTMSCLNDVFSQMAQEKERGYEYDTIFCVSCAARYYADSLGGRVETSLLSSNLPAGMTGIGFYSFGEIGPVPTKEGTQQNRSHSHTLVLCAI